MKKRSVFRPFALAVSLALVSGCAAAPVFQMSSLEPDAAWFRGQHEVRRESGGVAVAAAFERCEGGLLFFDIAVVNRSRATLDIDPVDFTYTVEASGTTSTDRPGLAVHAVDPEAQLARLDLGIAQSEASHATLVGLDLVGGVLDVAVDVASAGTRTEAESREDDRQDRERDADRRHEDASHTATMNSLTEQRHAWASTTLRRTQLAPGEHIAGRVAFPSAALARFKPRPAGGRGARTEVPAAEASAAVLRLHFPFADTTGGVRFRARRVVLPF